MNWSVANKALDHTADSRASASDSIWSGQALATERMKRTIRNTTLLLLVTGSMGCATYHSQEYIPVQRNDNAKESAIQMQVKLLALGGRFHIPLILHRTRYGKSFRLDVITKSSSQTDKAVVLDKVLLKSQDGVVYDILPNAPITLEKDNMGYVKPPTDIVRRSWFSNKLPLKWVKGGKCWVILHYRVGEQPFFIKQEYDAKEERYSDPILHVYQVM